MPSRITIIDYDAGNLRNVQKAVERLGYPSICSNKVEDIENADVLILPGVGAFNDGMDAIENLGLDTAIRKQVINDKKPILGICLGMQLFAQEGFEGGRRRGLALLPIVVSRLQSEEEGYRLPHIGWNNIAIRDKSLLFHGVPANPDFYFVHSFHAKCQDSEIVAATAEYGHRFVAAIESENIFATQFHPEKSQRYGLQVLKNFMSFCEGEMRR